MMKPWASILITVIVTAGIAGGGTYYFINKSTTVDKDSLQSQITELEKKLVEKEAVATVASETADWKTYANTKYGYSVKFSPDWQSKDFGMIDSDNPSYVGFAKTAMTNPSQSIISIGYTNLGVVGYRDKLQNTLGNYKAETLMVNEIQMDKITGNDEGGNQVIYITNWPGDSKTGVYLRVGSSDSADLEIFNKMIATFQFTD